MSITIDRANKTHPLLTGVKTCRATIKIGIATPQEDENWSTSRFNCMALEHTPKVCFVLAGTCSTMFTGALHIMARNWNLDVPQQKNK